MTKSVLLFPANLCGSDPTWIFFQNYCYRLSDASGPNSALSWYDAQSYCNSQGSNLVSIHNLQENELLFGYVIISSFILSFKTILFVPRSWKCRIYICGWSLNTYPFQHIFLIVYLRALKSLLYLAKKNLRLSIDVMYI